MGFDAFALHCIAFYSLKEILEINDFTRDNQYPCRNVVYRDFLP